MKRELLLALAISFTTMYAIDDSVGVREYKANCRVCHGVPSKGASMLTISEWDAMFINGFEKLKTKHSGNQQATELFGSPAFDKDSKKLLEFLKNNALDSGNIRACSGASCG